MPAAKYIVDLSPEERQELLEFVRHGKKSARQITRAHILLKADQSLGDEEIADDLHTGVATVGRVRKRFVEEGVPSALYEKPRPGQQRKLTGKQEARLIAEACSPAPKGHARWTLRLLADRAVQLELADQLSHETVRRLLKKTNSNLGKSKNGASRK
jgi:transposase